MSSIAALIKPARQHNETYEHYVARRKEGNAAIKKFLKGRLIWAANKIVTIKLNAKGLPVIPGAEGEDGLVDRTVQFIKKVDGTYESAKHGPIGTAQTKRSKKSWGMKR